MNTDAINGELTITYPKGCRVMGIDELKLSFGVSYQSIWGVRDEKQHMLFAVFWKETSGLMAKVGRVLATEASLAKRAEKGARKAYQTSDYELEGFFTRQIAGTEAQGFSYFFTTDDVRQRGETIVVKHDTRCYTLYYYTQADYVEQNRSAYDHMLGTLAFA